MQTSFPWPIVGQVDVRNADITSELASGWKRLFSPPDGKVEVSVAEVTQQDLRKHISRYYGQGNDNDAPHSRGQESLARCAKTSFFVIEPHYGWSTLPITRDGLLSLFKELEVFPEIYRFLTAFGRKEFFQDESFGGFDARITSTGSSDFATFELCYLLKYVAKVTNPPPGSFCWAIRHTLVYQKVDTGTKRSSHILVRPSTPVTTALAASLRADGATSMFVSDWTYLHNVCFRSVDADFRNMINFLDEEITNLSDRVVMFGVELSNTNEINSVQSSTRDFKSLQFISDRARRVITCIEINIHTIECLRDKMNRFANWDTFDNPNDTPIYRLLTDLSKSLEEHRFACRNALAVLARAVATTQFLRDTISLRNSEINKSSSETVSENTRTIARLANLSGRDARVVKTLTVLALVFVPASFVADFVQMGFVTISQESPMRWKADSDLKIYAILALPLITITIGGSREVFKYIMVYAGLESQS
ncbi:hypothetical protein FGRA07_09544 [Fusarium graminearum]|nr:hypothetical protein HG531_008369 [Fusarium graminearum]PCD32292.1 hypothetical protein FGRA07_09544 [Fusarium graminearum]